MFSTHSWGFHLDLPRLAQGLEALFLLLVIVVVVAATAACPLSSTSSMSKENLITPS